MLVKLIYGTKTIVKEVQSNISTEDIEVLFKVIFGDYNSKECRYLIIKEGD